MTAPRGLRRYARSCGLLLIPALLWNVMFTDTLMPASAMREFWRDIPAPLAFSENVLRAIVFGLPFAMPLQCTTTRERRAVLVFMLGTGTYFASWMPLMYRPHSAWSMSVLGALAPAYTPMLFLPALAVLGRQLYWGRWYRWWMYLLVSVTFVAVHTGHAGFVRLRSDRELVGGREPSGPKRGDPLRLCRSLRCSTARTETRLRAGQATRHAEQCVTYQRALIENLERDISWCGSSD
jgi:hypothetical protein